VRSTCGSRHDAVVPDDAPMALLLSRRSLSRLPTPCRSAAVSCAMLPSCSPQLDRPSVSSWPVCEKVVWCSEACRVRGGRAHGTNHQGRGGVELWGVRLRLEGDSLRAGEVRSALRRGRTPTSVTLLKLMDSSARQDCQEWGTGGLGVQKGALLCKRPDQPPFWEKPSQDVAGERFVVHDGGLLSAHLLRGGLP
jgi:hypothetical protein